MIRRPCTTGIEPVNAAALSCREMARLRDPHDQTSKGTRTHVYPKTSSQLAPPLVLVWEVAELHRGLHKADQGQHWAAEPSSRRLFFCGSWGCPSGWRGCETGASFIACICWRDASWTNGCSSNNQSHTDVIFSFLVGRDKLFSHSAIFIMRLILKESFVDVVFCHFHNEICFKRGLWISEKSQNTCENFKVRNIYLISGDPKWDELSKVHTACTPRLHMLLT